jgi:signal peptidase I
MTNLLEAICNIIENENFGISHRQGNNRVNSVGLGLESYVKDAFANSFQIVDEQSKMRCYSNVFSWTGNQNHPPDFMLIGGDAVEVKKMNSRFGDLALNSSYPKAKLLATSNMIADGCRTCEVWEVKDLIYCVGHTLDTQIKSIWFVYGDIYAASDDIYLRIKNTITEGINQIPNIELSETNELGRVNKVDPLGITNLRVRGMWAIQNPRKVFEYLIPKSNYTNFQVVAIIPLNKYNSFPQNSLRKIENLDSDDLVISNGTVKDPNNPARIIDVKLIVYSK